MPQQPSKLESGKTLTIIKINILAFLYPIPDTEAQESVPLTFPGDIQMLIKV